MFAKSFKTFIFQKFRRPLYHKVNLPSCVHVAWRSLCHKVNLPISCVHVAWRSLWNHHTRPNYCTSWDEPYDITSLPRLFHDDTQFKWRFRCKQSLHLKYAIKYAITIHPSPSTATCTPNKHILVIILIYTPNLASLQYTFIRNLESQVKSKDFTLHVSSRLLRISHFY